MSQYLSKPKDDRTRRAGGPFGGWIQGELKIRERRSQDGGSNGTTGGDITKESEEMQIEALERGFTSELKEMYGEENITSVVDPRRRDNAPSAL